MKKRIMVLLAASGLAVTLVGFGLMAQLNLDEALERYPGALLLDTRIDFASGALQRQSTFQTADELLVVRRWYAERFHVSPASDVYLTPVNGCVWLTQSKLTWRVDHNVSVLLCTLSQGTRISVNESVSVYALP